MMNFYDFSSIKFDEEKLQNGDHEEVYVFLTQVFVLFMALEEKEFNTVLKKLE